MLTHDRGRRIYSSHRRSFIATIEGSNSMQKVESEATPNTFTVLTVRLNDQMDAVA